MSACIIWDKALNKAGYPVAWDNGGWVYAHRVVAGAKKGEVVRHTCDNPSCVNPEHLIVGTHKQNSEDMVSKNRQAKGEQCGNSKLTTDTVLRIRALKGELSSRKVAASFRISKTNVLDIWNGKIWSHI